MVENKSMNDNWKFKDPENTAVFTTAKVLKDGKPILHVSHDADGAWQFHTGEDVEEKDSMVVSLKEMVRHDPYLADLADLALGWVADRKSANETWDRKLAE